MMILLVNGVPRDVPADWEGESLLAVLREVLGLWSVKAGCGKGECGACTVLVDGRAEHACTLEARQALGHAVLTLEGLAPADGGLHPLQQVWLDERVSQCGFCQAGQILRAAALLASDPHPTRASIDDAMAGHLCRCGTYARVRRAIERAASERAGPGTGSGPALPGAAFPTAALHGRAAPGEPGTAAHGADLR